MSSLAQISATFPSIPRRIARANAPRPTLAWWAPFQKGPAARPLVAERPSWEVCALRGLTLEEAATARGVTRDAALSAEARLGLRFRRAPVEPVRSAESAWRACAEAGMTLAEAAASRGRSVRTAETAARRYGLVFRREEPKPRAVITPATVLRAGDSIASVAEEAGVTPSTVRRRLVAAGLPPRLLNLPPQGREHHRAVAEALPWREAFAYLLDVIEMLEGSNPSERAVVTLHGLTRVEAAILLRLVRAKGEIVTHDVLWAVAAPFRHDGSEPDPGGLYVRIGHIRRKIARWPGALIKTVHGEGYRLVREPGHAFPWEPTPA